MQATGLWLDQTVRGTWCVIAAGLWLDQTVRGTWCVIAATAVSVLSGAAMAMPLSITFDWSIAGGSFNGLADSQAYTATASLTANAGTLTLAEGQSVDLQIQDWSWSVNASAAGIAEFSVDRLLTLDGQAQTLDQDFRITSAYSSTFGAYVKSGRLLDSEVLTYDFGPRGKVDVKLLAVYAPPGLGTTGTSAFSLISQGNGALARLTAYDIIPEPASLLLLLLGGVTIMSIQRP